MTKYIARLNHDQARSRAMQAVKDAPTGYVVRITPPTRSLEQNARLWAMLTDVSRQVEWVGRWLSQDEWKIMFSASLKKQEVIPGIDGGFVVMGQSTSNMTVREMCDLQEIISAFGSEHGVIWSDNEAVAT